MIRNDNKGEKVMDLETKKILMNDCSAMDLDSVGSYITKDLLVFPIDCNEPPETASEAEEMCGVHIYDLSDEWFTSLSVEDLTDFFTFVELNTHEILSGPYGIWKTKLWGKWEEVNNCYMNLDAIGVA
tara:strand:- start:3078 stop:3461 length:384 start_codon:yes stop_codon:yes gene_type:complete